MEDFYYEQAQMASLAKETLEAMTPEEIVEGPYAQPFFDKLLALIHETPIDEVFVPLEQYKLDIKRIFTMATFESEFCRRPFERERLLLLMKLIELGYLTKDEIGPNMVNVLLPPFLPTEQLANWSEFSEVRDCLDSLLSIGYDLEHEWRSLTGEIQLINDLTSYYPVAQRVMFKSLLIDACTALKLNGRREKLRDLVSLSRTAWGTLGGSFLAVLQFVAESECRIRAINRNLIHLVTPPDLPHRYIRQDVASIVECLELLASEGLNLDTPSPTGYTAVEQQAELLSGCNHSEYDVLFSNLVRLGCQWLRPDRDNDALRILIRGSNPASRLIAEKLIKTLPEQEQPTYFYLLGAYILLPYPMPTSYAETFKITDLNMKIAAVNWQKAIEILEHHRDVARRLALPDWRSAAKVFPDTVLVSWRCEITFLQTRNSPFEYLQQALLAVERFEKFNFKSAEQFFDCLHRVCRATMTLKECKDVFIYVNTFRQPRLSSVTDMLGRFTRDETLSLREKLCFLGEDSMWKAMPDVSWQYHAFFRRAETAVTDLLQPLLSQTSLDVVLGALKGRHDVRSAIYSLLTIYAVRLVCESATSTYGSDIETLCVTLFEKGATIMWPVCSPSTLFGLLKAPEYFGKGDNKFVRHIRNTAPLAMAEMSVCCSLDLPPELIATSKVFRRQRVKPLRCLVAYAMNNRIKEVAEKFQYVIVPCQRGGSISIVDYVRSHTAPIRYSHDVS